MAGPGRPPGPGNKPWADAIRVAVNAHVDGTDTKKLRTLAEKVVSLGLAGDMAALKEIGDRLDGKPAQAITGDPENPLQVASTVTVTLVKPSAAG